MKVIKPNELRDKVSELLPDYEFSVLNGNEPYDECIHAVKELPVKRYRDNKRNRVVTHNRRIFISSRMYKDADKDFRYAMIYTQADMKQYRCRSWYKAELNKVFISDADDNILLEKIKELFV